MTQTTLASPTAAAPHAAPIPRAILLLRAADALLPLLVQGVAIDARTLRAAMEAAFGGSDAEGLWAWKDAYEVCEAAQLLFLRRFGPALSRQSAEAQLGMISKIAALLPTQTRRSQESQALQQFSTPLPLAWIVARAADLRAEDLVLEPSAGTGLLAIFAELSGAGLALNELGEGRSELLGHLFPTTPVTRFDAAHIHDHLDPAVRPTVVLMNPPFSAGAHVEGRVADAALRHMSSALARLSPGGRLVAITGAGLSPYAAAWREGFHRLQERGRLLFSAAIDGRVYARHGTTTETRLTIIDRQPAQDPTRFPDSPGRAGSAAELLSWVEAQVPPRAAASAASETSRLCPKAALRKSGFTARRPAPASAESNGRPLRYAVRDWSPPAGDRIFNHLITAMKTPTLIIAIDRDLTAGHACVVQIVSTGEALLERRLADIPTEEWGDVAVDITPREYVLDYLAHSFPTQLFEPFTDGEGNLSSRPVMRDGQPVQCRDAVDRRDRLIEHLASLPPVQGALDQIIQRFGTEQVAEVTGRSRRVVARTGDDGERRLAVEGRAASANLAETAAFQDDEKRILIFSDAGGTGRSYHADLGAKNRRLRIHYLLEAGWKADTAIQGLGRTNRTHQAQPPIFRPISTNVKAEKRFLSTIARRLDTLGAITKGQRQTGGQGLFRAQDNLESPYAKAALRQLYMLLLLGKVPGCSLQRFEDATGLKLTDRDGTIREELPPITQFLNRMLALNIALQDGLFEVFEGLLRAKIEGAISAGVYDRGVETITAHSLRVIERRALYTHPGSGAETQVFTILERNPTAPLSLEDALERGRERGCRLLINTRSRRAAVQVSAPSLTLDDGEVERRIRLLRPMERTAMAENALPGTAWEVADADQFAEAWNAEIAELPPFTETTLHIVTGLLLPIWRRLPSEGCRVYRLQTDDGERVIGRQVSGGWVAQAFDETPAPIAPSDALAAVLLKGETLHLADALTVRRSLVTGVQRLELAGFTDGMVARLKALGLMSEIIGWKLRLFIPTGGDGPAVLAALLARHPLARIAPRASAHVAA